MEKFHKIYNSGKVIIIECVDFEERRKLHSLCSQEGFNHKSFICNKFSIINNFYFLSLCCKKMSRVKNYSMGYLKNNADGIYYMTCPKCRKDFLVEEIDASDYKTIHIKQKNAIKIGKSVIPVDKARNKSHVAYSEKEIKEFIRKAVINEY